ncbi:hypothetical protein [Labrys sp. 22185]|uniref:hypothetical protein n=1 Tax=Labrys sp. 22185 TaxID=3453888 RepID=UPI003F82F567
MNVDGARRKILWEVRIIGACCALMLSGLADYAVFRESPLSLRPLILMGGSALCILVLPDRFFWSRGHVSIARTILTAGLAPNFCGFFSGVPMAIAGLITSKPVPGLPSIAPSLGDLLGQPIFLAIFPSVLTAGMLNFVSVLVGLAVGSWASWRHMRLLLGTSA